MGKVIALVAMMVCLVSPVCAEDVPKGPCAVNDDTKRTAIDGVGNLYCFDRSNVLERDAIVLWQDINPCAVATLRWATPEQIAGETKEKD